MRSTAIALASVLLVACSTNQSASPNDPGPSPIATASASPPSAAENYLKPLSGFRYGTLDGKPSVDFRTPLETNPDYRTILESYAARSILFNGDSYGVVVEVYAVDPVAATRRGLQKDLVSALAGKQRVISVGLGGRGVSYWNIPTYNIYAWVQLTWFVLVSAEDDGKAAQVVTALIKANSTEAHFTISGQVLSAANDNPVPDVSVFVSQADGTCCSNVVPGVVTGATGRYQFSVASGSYRILFYPAGLDGYGAGWYREATDFETSDIVNVSRNTILVDGKLPVGHVVAGTLRSSGGTPTAGHVDAYSAATGGWVTGLDIESSGNWILRLATGRYRLEFWGPVGSLVRPAWWRTGDTIQSSEVITVGGQDQRGLEMTIGARGSA